MQKAWLSSAQEIADYIGISKDMIRKLAKLDKLPAKKILGKWRALAKDVDEWAEKKLR